MKISTSEVVSLGHPDKIADFISCTILDEYLKHDKNVKYALEVMIKDNNVVLGGEVSSSHHIDDEQMKRIVREAISEIGYTKSYAEYWGRENTICCDTIDVISFISQQSNDINIGVRNNGWGDQGIFWGMATPTSETNYFPKDFFIANELKNEMMKIKYAGRDIKTLITTKDDEVTNVICAVPLKEPLEAEVAKKIISFTGCENYILNGTGKYVQHSSIADCGITGRKLAADFYGGNCRIGGGSPWTKDGTKADLTLNLYARYLAKKYSMKYGVTTYCSIACCIGQKRILVVFYDEKNNLLNSYYEEKEPIELIEMFKLDTPIFKELCKDGLFKYV